MKQLCWIIIALFMGKLTNVQMFLTEQSLLSPDQATRDEGWKGCVLASDGDFKILCVAFNPTKLNEIQNQIQCFAGNNFKVTHLHLPLQKCCSLRFWSWNGFVCYNSFLISDSRESLDQACLAEENIVSKYFSMKICHKFPKCVFNVKQSF